MIEMGDRIPGKTSEGTPEVFYFDLDALLDTRIAVLANESDELAINALNSDYWNRKQDAFPGVSKQEFQQLWKARTSDILPLTTRTNIITFVRTLAKEKLSDAAIENMESSPKLVVNIHPYELSDEEAKELIEVLVESTASIFDVQVVNIPNELLTPQYCKENFAIMARYEWMPWLEMHQQAFEKTKMPAVALVVPCLFDQIPSEREHPEAYKRGGQLFREVEKMLAPLMRLVFVDIESFSMDRLIKNA